MATAGSIIKAGADKVVTQVLSYHPEWRITDSRHVPWSPSFVHTLCGTEPGQRAMTRDGKHPCEVVELRRAGEKLESVGRSADRGRVHGKHTLLVHFPRVNQRRMMDVSELEPYEYASSSEKSLTVAPKPSELEGFVGDGFMNKIDELVAKIRGDEYLWEELQRVSLMGDKPGVTFMMGVSPRTGVPYGIMSRKLIAELWLAMREHFQRHNLRRLHGSKLTNIRVNLGAQDSKPRTLASDFGEAVVISGGIHVGGQVEREGRDKLSTWGRFVALDRSRPFQTEPWTGEYWSLTMFSWVKARSTQAYAMWMMDSVTLGNLIERQDQPDLPVVNSSVDSEMEIKHSDHKYPPWQSRDVDEHGMPLPLQPKDLGPDGKWKVKPATKEELDKAMKDINVASNELLDDKQKLQLRQLHPDSPTRF